MRYITFCAAILLALSCGKDKPETRPSIKIKSISPLEVQDGQPLSITLEFADKEGDVDDTLYIKRDRLNKIDGLNNNQRTNDEFFEMIPPFPSKANGEILLSLKYHGYLADAQSPRPIPNTDPVQYVADSIRFRFALHDRAGNVSDTVISEQVVILR